MLRAHVQHSEALSAGFVKQRRLDSNSFMANFTVKLAVDEFTEAHINSKKPAPFYF